MTRKILCSTLAGAALLCVPPAAARAQVVPFTGTRTAENIPVPTPDVGRCGATPNTLISGIVGTGTSNLGAFTTVESNCLNPVTGSLFNGLFNFAFGGGNTLFGTATGTVALPPVNGTTTNVFEYLITGGTGLYAGATGRLQVNGVVRFNPDGTTGNTFTYNGSFSTVPEPSAVLVLGAGLVGVAALARRRRRAASRP
jgi:hypothetical protein